MYAADGVQASPPTPTGGSKPAGSGAEKEFAKALNSQKAVSGQKKGGAAETSATTNNLTVTSVRTDTANDISGDVVQQPADGSGQDRPAADGTFGKTEYTVASGDTLESVAEDHEQTVADVLLANPGLTESTPLEEGTTVAILDDRRLAIAEEMATTTDPVRLNELVREEMLYATMLSPTPEDLLPAVQGDMLARRTPGDQTFAAIVDEQSEWSTQFWQAQGRTHAVMDPLFALTAAGETAALEQNLLTVFRTVAATSPTPDSIADQKNLLLAYGPQSQAFVDAINRAEAFFTSGWPQQAATEIATAYATEGPVAAARLLATHTQAGQVDPLTAARILNAAQPTVVQMITHLSGPGWQDWPGNPGGDDFYMDLEGFVTVFDRLNAAADNASRSTEAAASIETMARLINEQDYYAVSQSIEIGSGIVLPLEMLKLSGDPMLADGIFEGIAALKDRIRESVGEFADTALEITEPAALWGGLVEDPDALFNQVLDQVRPDGTTLRAALTDDIGRLSNDGYQMMRVILAMDAYAPHLDEFPDLLAAGAAPAPDTDPAIELVLGSTPALIEGIRSENVTGLQDRSVLNPASLSIDPSWAIRMSRNTGRNALQAWFDYSKAQVAPGTRLGVQMALFGLGTYVLGVANQTSTLARNSATPGWLEGGGWRTVTADLMYASGVALEGTQAVSGLLAQRMSLMGLDTPALNALPGWQRAIATAASGGGPLQAAYNFHLRAFGVFNLLAAIDEFGKGDAFRGTAYTLAGSGTLTALSSRQIAQGTLALLGAPAAGAPLLAARIAFFANAVTWVATLALVGKGLHDQAARAAHTEPFQQAYLEQAGLRPEIAQALSDNDNSGRSPGLGLQALSDYLNLAPGELLEWMNQQDPYTVDAFVDFLIHPMQPDANGQFPVTVDWPPHAISLQRIVELAASSEIPLPDHRRQGGP